MKDQRSEAWELTWGRLQTAAGVGKAWQRRGFSSLFLDSVSWAGFR